MSTTARTRVLLAFALCALGCGSDESPAMQGNEQDAGAHDADANDAAAEVDAEIAVAGGLTIAFTAGSVRGALVAQTRQFLGIPYAKPPMGELRFLPPEPAEPWTGVREATAFGPSCIQAGSAVAPTTGTFSEDCLSLNIFTPEKVPAAGLPVFVFIHGGAFVNGGSIQYDGSNLSKAGPLVVVTLNYRVGPLGFFAHPGLDATRGEAPSGNDGLRDQQLALRWVKENIAAFGGDPARVTVAGESAGAMSTCLQLVSPTSKGLAQGFIMESGACIGGLPLLAKAASDALGTALTDELCADQADLLSCLRAKPAQELVDWRKEDTLFGAGFGPLLNPDDPFLPEAPRALLEKGNFSAGAILLGSNLNEWALFQTLGASPAPKTVAELGAAIDEQFGTMATAVKAHYVAESDAKANEVFVRLMTDATFRCPARGLARLVTAQGRKAFLYSFEEGPAQHAYEIPYVFGNPSPLLAPVLVESVLSAVQGYWTEFAAHGDPNGKDALEWPMYTADSDQHMTLKAEPEVASGLARDDCDFWESVVD